MITRPLFPAIYMHIRIQVLEGPVIEIPAFISVSVVSFLLLAGFAVAWLLFYLYVVCIQTVDVLFYFYRLMT